MASPRVLEKILLSSSKEGRFFLIEAPREKRIKDTLFHIIASFLSQNSSFPQEKILREIKKGSYPDAIFLSSLKSISIEEIREIERRYLPFPPLLGKKRIFFIEEGEKLTLEAQSALLKILEEPPSHTLFLLWVENKRSLLPTILSRAFYFPLVLPREPLKKSTPWRDFWYYTGIEGTEIFEDLEKKGWISFIEERWQRYSPDRGSLELIEEIGLYKLREFLGNSSQDIYLQTAYLSFLPLWFSFRDALFQCLYPSYSPISLFLSKEEGYLFFQVVSRFLFSLKVRFFGKIPPRYFPRFFLFWEEYRRLLYSL